jgi:hypothetical protein
VKLVKQELEADESLIKSASLASLQGAFEEAPDEYDNWSRRA